MNLRRKLDVVSDLWIYLQNHTYADINNFRISIDTNQAQSCTQSITGLNLLTAPVILQARPQEHHKEFQHKHILKCVAP